MKTQPDSGGPAFPRPVSEDRTSGDQHDGNSTVSEQDGMSLRDWFAGKAMPEVIKRHPGAPTHAAAVAYEFADAMIASRKK